MERGYFVHPNAICETVHVGERSRIWAFAHVLSGARIGADCNICDGVFVENDVIVGDRVTVKCGVQLWDGVEVESDVFIGPNVTFTNDLFPRSRIKPPRFSRTWLKRGCSIGANATILADVVIGEDAMIGAGAVVTKNVPPRAKVIGNPGIIVGYVHDAYRREGSSIPRAHDVLHQAGESSKLVGGSEIRLLKRFRDMRGSLCVADIACDIPFEPKRFFFIFDVPSREVRGEHAHRSCEQFLVCLRGSCEVLLDDGIERQQILLNKPNFGIFMPAMIWGAQYSYSPDAILLVCASEPYDSEDYVRDYKEFLELVANAGAR